MDALSALADGFRVALVPMNLLWALAGVTLGTLVGVLPGVGPALTVALLLPVTFSLQPVEAFIMFAGIYYGGMYGGSTTAILLNTPGESASIMTAVEGNLMARDGRAGAALATAAIGSFVAGTLATIALTLAAPLMVDVALGFGPAEYFALTVLAFVAVTAVLGDSMLNGLASLFFGLALGLVGIDPLSGEARLTFGLPQLLDGIDVVVVAVGLFAVGETLYAASKTDADDRLIPLRGSVWMTRDDWSRSWRPWLRGALLGFPIGALPAGGAEIPTFLSYGVERHLARDPAAFGKGAIEGVAGPEAANNAAATGALVPLLTLGLPTSATAAILLAAFQQYGLQPGPLLFTRDAAAGLGPDCEPLYRQRHAAGAQPAARRPVGAAPVDPAAVSARRHSRARQRRRVQRQPLGLRRRPALRDRRRGIRDANLGDPARAGGDRLDPRADGRAAAAPRARRGGGLVGGVRHAADLGRCPGCCRHAGAASLRLAALERKPATPQPSG